MSLNEKIRSLVATDEQGSLASRTRTRRFEDFEQLFADLASGVDRPLRILDIGGTNSFWEQRGWAERDDVRIVITNLKDEPQLHENIEPRVMDATRMKELEDGSFDLVFSNSVIEHLGTLLAQAAMAAEIRRLAAVYWVQTPNFWFPVEPHFLTLAWHWLPVSTRIALLRRRGWGWYGRTPDPAEARELVAEIRLLRRAEFHALFPDSRLVEERWGGLVKSFVAVRDGRSSQVASAVSSRRR